ncbi:protein of unknown function [Pseudonocardia thermophila]|jgi:Domain of unknown function (DUF1918).|uniref:DUF1918 domain-containing protein n=1 Tax=Pseudonocardia thermophila TaxID=1848 RepID=A0A1M6XN82_PSETH|nr:DUF1918 domain-containing protein [Pseudonocardia thermophila]SHL07319.1 protein of unknown function [Pseudonocardia thermophila]
MRQAAVGDRIRVEGPVVDAARREGDVVEVISTGERPLYRVRWQDGHESLFFPGPDAHVVPKPAEASV